MSIGKRLREIRNYLNLTQEKFAQPLSITRGYIATIENDLQEPSDALLKLISAEYSISIAWLKAGEGKMFISPEDALKNQIARFGKQTVVGALKNILEKEYQTGMETGIDYIREIHYCQDPELLHMIRTLQDIWATSDDRFKSWASIQFDFAFPKHIIKAKLQKDTSEEYPLNEHMINENQALLKKRITTESGHYVTNNLYDLPPNCVSELKVPAEEPDDINLDEIMLVAHTEGREILRPLSPELKAIVKDAIRISRQRRKKKEENMG